MCNCYRNQCLQLPPAPGKLNLKTYVVRLGPSTAPIDKGQGEKVLIRKAANKKGVWRLLFPGIPYKGRTKFKSVKIDKIAA